MQLHTPAFKHGTRIPRRYSGDGDDLSPPLEWTGAPDGTRSFALVVEDPDAPRGHFRHWGVYDIAADRDGLPEGAGSGTPARPLGLTHNDFGHARYNGPLPPHGHGVHHYHFRLFALDVAHLDLPEQARVGDLLAALEGHVLASAELTGLYDR